MRPYAMTALRYLTRRFYHIENAFFLPHMASNMDNDLHGSDSKKDKRIAVLFPGSYRSVDSLYDEIKERFPNGIANRLAMQTLERLLSCPWETLEVAFET